jgi:hypothetical protein
MTLINREDVLALIPRYVSPAMASDLADAIAALPAQVGEPEGAVELLREVMAQGVEHNTSKYAVVQMSHGLLVDIRAFLKEGV